VLISSCLWTTSKDSRAHAIFVYWEGFATLAALFWAVWCLGCELRQHLSLEAPSLRSWHEAHWSLRLGLLATCLVESESCTEWLCCETTQEHSRLLQVRTRGPTDCFRIFRSSGSNLYSPGPLFQWEHPPLEVNEFSTTVTHVSQDQWKTIPWVPGRRTHCRLVGGSVYKITA
jgi:hypothetical protein